MNILARLYSALRPKTIYDLIVGLIVFVVGVPCLYWALLDTHPVADTVSEVTTKVVRQGELFQVHYKVRWNRSCRLQGYRFIIDSAGGMHTIEPDQRWVNEGADEFTISVPVPLAAAPGPAKYKATLLYECNPWQRYVAPLQRDIRERPFEILPGSPTAGGLSFRSHGSRTLHAQLPAMGLTPLRRPAGRNSPVAMTGEGSPPF